jgi:uncharacterized protein YjbI with pentapeptide repeats
VSVWVIAVALVAVVAFAFVPGIRFWWPSRTDPGARTDLGISLMTGAFIALAVLALQVLFDLRLSDLEDTRQDERESEQARQTVLLQVNLNKDLTGMKLRGLDLSGLYLSGKTLGSADLNGTILRDALLVGTDLRGAELADADLTGAYLQGAHLEQTLLTRAHLDSTLLQGAHLENADLRGASFEKADLSSAFLQGTDLRGATRLASAGMYGVRYDAYTKWPADFRMKKCREGRVCWIRQ